jgi:CubicO group peptidase (beta-lactamase class C family)
LQLGTLIVLTIGVTLLENGALAQPRDPDTASRVSRIEADVLPAVVPDDQPRISSPLIRRMADLKVPGVSIAMIHGGRVEWAKGFGALRTTGASVTPDTLFQAGSISKSVTAMAVLRLVQAGTLDLDVDVNSYLKGWKIPENQFNQKSAITLRKLLTHTGGITVHGFEGYAAGKSVPTLLQILDGVTPANNPPIIVDTPPGMMWRYSGGGYVIVQKILQDVTGKPFAQLMQEEVLNPLRMTHSTFVQPLPTALRPYAAEPYDENGKAYPGGPYTYPEMAAAGLWTTPSDLAKFAIAIQASLTGKPGGILRKSTAEEMLKRGGLGHWGLGLELGGSDDQPFFQHGGADTGFISFLIAYYRGDGLVIMTNGMNGGGINYEVLRAVAREYDWPNYQPKTQAQKPKLNSAQP